MSESHARTGIVIVALLSAAPLLATAPLELGAAQPTWAGAFTGRSDTPPPTTAATQPDEESAETPTTRPHAPAESEPTSRSVAGDSAEPATQPKPPEPQEEPARFDSPQVEVYVPSVAALSEAARRSKTARLYAALSGMIPTPTRETDEDFDVVALLHLVERIADWPDTSIALTTYTQDREGRPRWALRVDWPLADLTSRVRSLLEDEAASKLLENMELREDEQGAFRVELPEMVLAVLFESETGSYIASSAALKPPEAIFGQPEKAARSVEGQPASAPAEKTTARPKGRFLLYCRLNMEAGDESERANSLFSRLSVIKDIRYALSLKKDGQWSERWSVIWNPLLGGALKVIFQKARHPFACPTGAYATAALHIGGGGLADALAGLPPGTLGGRAGGEMAFTAAPGTGFLPFPDLFYEFRARRKDAIIKDVRAFIAKDTRKRRDEDRLPAWHEEKIDHHVVFWHDPAADGRYALMPVTYRNVLFFEEPTDEAGAKTRLIIAQTSTWAEDAIENWKALRKETIRMPSSKKTHWQARIGWRRIYALAQPYLGVLAGLSEEATIPPEAEELDDALADSVINIQVRLSGLRVRHRGPIPLGTVYVPAVAAASLAATADPSSEAARERTACRHLRVLHHHARLFKKDYGRWPATVAELDGYVDFASHPHLLRLRAQEKSFVAGLTSLLLPGRRTPRNAQADEEEIDDSLYEIDWSEDEREWRLKFREGEFKSHTTIYIDAAGEIHRVEKTAPHESSTTDREEAAGKKEAAAL